VGCVNVEVGNGFYPIKESEREGEDDVGMKPDGAMEDDEEEGGEEAGDMD